MTTKNRPADCCLSPIIPMPLPETTRAATVGVFKALGDATRFEIFRFVAAQEEPICACDVVDRFQVSQPTISHHMKVLAEAGLITVSRRGVWAYYAVDLQGLRQIDSILGSFAPPESLVAS